MSHQEGSSSVSQVGLKEPVSTSDRKTSRGRLQSEGRSRGSRSWVSRNLENSERKACVKSYEGRSSINVEICASGTEESRNDRAACVWVVEAMESEMAFVRWELGQSPLLVASQAEEK